jgi:hypothetical protein
MTKPRLILPRADSKCGKVFFDDRRAAHGHRVALEFWNRATGQAREGYQLAVYRCRRCGGFHIGYKRVENAQDETTPDTLNSILDFADQPAPSWPVSALDSWSITPPRASETQRDS